MRPLYSLLIALLLSLTSIAQTFDGGLLAGASVTQLDGDGLGGYNRAGAILGVWVSRPFSETLSVRTELKFIQKGSYRRFTEGDMTIGDYSLRLNYAEMPFLLEYRFREDIVPFAGISAGYLWRSTEKNNGYENPIDEDTKFRNYELAAHAGVEYILNEKFSFAATFSYSILPVRRHSGNIFYLWNLDFGQYNNVLQFYVRYHF